MSVCCGCRALLGGGLCNELITRSEESTEYNVSECDRGTSYRRPRPTGAVQP
jgi:hypothetical protein